MIKLITLFFLAQLSFSQTAKDFMQLEGQWDVTQTLYNGSKVKRINKISDLFEGNGLLSYWYDENNNFVGSDVRTYEEDKDQWIMTWFDGKSKKWKKTRYLKRIKDIYQSNSNFSDQRGEYKERITFFNITKLSYEWKMEYFREQWGEWKTVMTYISIRKEI